MKRAIPSLFCGALSVVATTRSNAADSLTLDDLWTDTKLYFTAPIRWDAHDWAYVGVVAAMVAASHQADNRVRKHFAPNPVLDGKDKNSTRDFAPAAGMIVGTWAFAQLDDSQGGRVESYTMLEAAGFSTITTEALKYAAGRKRPNETLRVDDWRASGSSFPSMHTSIAFAVGTVLAESGSDDFRWTRRLLGYGAAAGTAYLRLHGNNHWLSDVVAGAAVGVSTGIFTLNRRVAHGLRDVDVSVSPAAGGGVALNLSWTLH